jgi:predicted PurR-regulated permease PerM
MNLLDDNRFSKISFFIIFVIVILISFKIVSSFVLAIIVGALLAQLIRPLQNKLVVKKIPPKISAYLILILMIVMMIIPLFFFTQNIIVETRTFTEQLSSSDISFVSIANNLEQWPMIHYFISDPSSLADQLRNATKSVAGMASNVVMYLAGQIPSLVIDTIFILLSFIVFLLNGEKIKNFVSNLIPLHQYIKSGLIISSDEISKMAFKASFLAAAGQSITMFLGFVILNIPNAFLAAGATFILSFIPLVGSVPVCLAGVAYLILKGSTVKIIFIVLFGIITGVIDNVIRALVLKGSKDKLHPFVGLVAVIGGIQVFGLLGVVIGPIFAALLLSMCKVWPAVLEKKEIKE